jgi:mycothiol synthase
MPLSVRTFVAADQPALHELLRDPGVAAEYERLVEIGEFDDPLRHPVLHPGGLFVAADGAALAGFAMLLRLDSAHGPWAHVRIGVRSSRRRRGVGTALLERVDRAIAEIPPADAPRVVAASAWLPADAARGFLEARGFAHYRYWWNMERPLGPVADVAWPDDVEVRPFDGSEHALAEWTACYNDAFAKRFPSHFATVDEARDIAAGPLFRADGCLLAWRGERCVGFCRDTIFSGHGEVDVLAVRPDAQGRGLGRALLRWGVAWLQAQGVEHVRLVVDGENEGALGLYRSEGFDIHASREMWVRSRVLSRKSC